jgi:hypothetical protein
MTELIALEDYLCMVLYTNSEITSFYSDTEKTGLPLVRLNVKHHHQPKDMYCVPTSIKMALDCVCKTHNVKGLKPFSIHKIAKITKTRTVDGTPPRAVELMNEHFLKARPSLSFVYREGSKFTEIDKELNDKQLPVIVYLNPAQKHHNRAFKLMHAVVIVEYDRDAHLIYFDDPEEETEATGMQSLEVGKFMKRWEWEKKWVQILLGKNQTYIAGFLELGGQSNE